MAVSFDVPKSTDFPRVINLAMLLVVNFFNERIPDLEHILRIVTNEVEVPQNATTAGEF